MTGWRFCAKELGVSVITIVAIGVVVTLLVDSVERSSLLPSIGVFQFLGLVLSRLVPLTREVFPMLVCGGVAFGVGRLRSRGDLSGLMATGISPNTLIFGALVVGLSSSLIACFLDVATPSANSYSEWVMAQGVEQGADDAGDVASWIPVSGGALRLQASTSEVLYGVEFVSADGGLSRVVADYATWVQGEWRLTGGMLYGADGSGSAVEAVDVVALPPPDALEVVLQGARLSYQSVTTLGVIGTDDAETWWHYRVSRILLVAILALWGFVFGAAFTLSPVLAASLATISGATVLSIEMALVQVAVSPAWIWAVLFLAALSTATLHRRRGITLV